MHKFITGSLVRASDKNVHHQYSDDDSKVHFTEDEEDIDYD